MASNPHSKIERSIFILIVLIVIVTSIGAIVQIFPLFKKEIAIEEVVISRMYTPLELAGFNIYKREGCYGCHSQQIRVLVDENERYGPPSIAAESMYDYPFQWGSKRTGPDLARVGEKYSDDWHVEHLSSPRSLVPESIMPNYAFLTYTELDTKDILKQMEIMKFLGVPYTDQHIANFSSDIAVQLNINTDPKSIEGFKKRYNTPPIRKFNKNIYYATEMDALVAYLQGLGKRVDLSTNKGRLW